MFSGSSSSSLLSDVTSLSSERPFLPSHKRHCCDICIQLSTTVPKGCRKIWSGTWWGDVLTFCSFPNRGSTEALVNKICCWKPRTLILQHSPKSFKSLVFYFLCCLFILMWNGRVYSWCAGSKPDCPWSERHVFEPQLYSTGCLVNTCHESLKFYCL